MLIHNTVTDFTENYLPTIDYLKGYYEKHASHFEEYFRYHCHNVDKKMKTAIPKVPICAACSGGVFELGGVNIGHFMKNNRLIH
ncbi:hypothetical protein [Lysinibacillus xylanilyticus]|uniref:hypothetical protein n=1 Tax=Lysinibacillus xylanilyticus TaxID=582475 RepID=UPI00083C90FE|nr:hypothetical protein [Lysinibacillus xylanilyticus]